VPSEPAGTRFAERVFHGVGEDGVDENIKRFIEDELLKPLERWFFGHSA